MDTYDGEAINKKVEGNALDSDCRKSRSTANKFQKIFSTHKIKQKLKIEKFILLNTKKP